MFRAARRFGGSVVRCLGVSVTRQLVTGWRFGGSSSALLFGASVVRPLRRFFGSAMEWFGGSSIRWLCCPVARRFGNWTGSAARCAVWLLLSDLDLDPDADLDLDLCLDLGLCFGLDMD